MPAQALAGITRQYIIVETPGALALQWMEMYQSLWLHVMMFWNMPVMQYEASTSVCFQPPASEFQQRSETASPQNGSPKPAATTCTTTGQEPSSDKLPAEHKVYDRCRTSHSFGTPSQLQTSTTGPAITGPLFGFNDLEFSDWECDDAEPKYAATAAACHTSCDSLRTCRLHREEDHFNNALAEHHAILAASMPSSEPGHQHRPFPTFASSPRTCSRGQQQEPATHLGPELTHQFLPQSSDAIVYKSTFATTDVADGSLAAASTSSSLVCKCGCSNKLVRLGSDPCDEDGCFDRCDRCHKFDTSLYYCQQCDRISCDSCLVSFANGAA
ncbi:unnamed protein product [Polarella glacialis]|uniref:Uncharacterized protein n=1 Tax=Polarella glacialis TaxID=89957 RepID=A0A813JAX6_POLGL|nr:unnamed protein product [Polarella glacialis]